MTFHAEYIQDVGSHLGYVAKRSDWRAMFQDLDSCELDQTLAFVMTLMNETVPPYDLPSSGSFHRELLLSSQESYDLRPRRIHDVIALADLIDTGSLTQRPEGPAYMYNIGKPPGVREYREHPAKMPWDPEKQIHDGGHPGNLRHRWSSTRRSAIHLICLMILLVVLVWRYSVSDA
ncbi:MAG: hypothetical protein Q9166_002710 [cf. Caloplaca sp. 2 TL-2023]